MKWATISVIVLLFVLIIQIPTNGQGEIDRDEPQETSQVNQTVVSPGHSAGSMARALRTAVKASVTWSDDGVRGLSKGMMRFGSNHIDDLARSLGSDADDAFGFVARNSDDALELVARKDAATLRQYAQMERNLPEFRQTRFTQYRSGIMHDYTKHAQDFGLNPNNPTPDNLVEFEYRINAVARNGDECLATYNGQPQYMFYDSSTGRYAAFDADGYIVDAHSIGLENPSRFFKRQDNRVFLGGYPSWWRGTP